MGMMIDAFEKTCCQSATIIMHHLKPYALGMCPFDLKTKFENFSNKQANSKFFPTVRLASRRIWLRELEGIVGLRIRLGINLFLIQVLDGQKAIWIVSIFTQVINVLNIYD